MKIQKILNNNVVIARDENDKEVIVMSLGLGFRKKQGDLFPRDDSQKIFVLSDEVKGRRVSCGILLTFSKTRLLNRDFQLFLVQWWCQVRVLITLWYHQVKSGSFLLKKKLSLPCCCAENHICRWIRQRDCRLQAENLLFHSNSKRLPGCAPVSLSL